jgi:plastocyanin
MFANAGGADREKPMRTHLRLFIAAAITLGPAFAAVGTVEAQQAGPTITITDFKNDPADLQAKVGEGITVVNNDPFPHTVTAQDGTFDVEVPAKGNVSLTVSKPGAFPYKCTFHPSQHNPASINVS